MSQAPGKAYRKGINIFEVNKMFADEDNARKWIENIVWQGDNPVCPKCRKTNTYAVKPNPALPPYRCRDCKSYFSVRNGTILEDSPLPFSKWAMAIYLFTTSLKGVSSMKLHRDIGVTQKTAWFMLQRLRTAFEQSHSMFEGVVEVDEMYVGGKDRNKHERDVDDGRGSKGKKPVLGAKNRESKQVRAKVVDDTKGETLRGFVNENVNVGDKTRIFTDSSFGYRKLPNQEAVKHSAREYVRGMVHTNGIESFWAMFKRSHKGTYHKMSPKHLQKYVDEFVWRQNNRPLDMAKIMSELVKGLIGKRLTYQNLTREGLYNAGRFGF